MNDRTAKGRTAKGGTAKGGAFVLLTMLVGLLATPAFAHGELIASSPFAGQTVGGDLRVIELVLSEEVEVVDIGLVGPEGDVATKVRQPSANVVLIDLDGTATDGTYSLDYELKSLVDQDTTDGFLAFRYEAGASPALSVVGTTVVPVGSSQRQTVFVVVALVVLGAGFGAVVAKWRRLRRLQAP